MQFIQILVGNMRIAHSLYRICETLDTGQHFQLDQVVHANLVVGRD